VSLAPAGYIITYGGQFERFGQCVDIDKAINCSGRALRSSPEDPNRSSWLHTLGRSHQSRFEILSELVDIDKVIEYGTQEAFLTDDRNGIKTILLEGLALSYVSILCSRRTFGY
jgi:hypothetical protein